MNGPVTVQFGIGDTVLESFDPGAASPSPFLTRFPVGTVACAADATSSGAASASSAASDRRPMLRE